MNKLKQFFALQRELKGLTFLRALHLAARPFFRAAGFKWELRRRGELKIGLWRKQFQKNKTSNNKKNRTAPRRLIVLPGFGDSSLAWAQLFIPLQPFIKREFDELIFVDFPGFSGFLSSERPFHSMTRLMEDLGDILDSLEPRMIFGHSLGGWLTAHYAANCGTLKRPTIKNQSRRRPYAGPESIMVVNPSGVFSSEDEKVSFRKIFDEARFSGIEAYRSYIFAREPLWFRFALKEVGRFFKKSEIHQFIESVDNEHFITEELPHIRCNVFILWGEHDTLAPARWIETWMEKLALRPEKYRAQAVLIKKAGHSPHVERPALTAALIAHILSGQKEVLKSITPKRLIPRLKSQWNRAFWTVLE